jgi:hypothetical protein
MGDTFEPSRRRAQKREKRLSTVLATVLVVVLTIAAAAILAPAGGRLSSDRAAVAAFRAAPTCAGSVSAAAAVSADCQEVAPYKVTYTNQQGGGGSWKAFIGLQPASGAPLQLQFAQPGNELGFADVGDTVSLTSWHGVPILVANQNQVLTAELVNPLLESGDGPYLWLWYTAACYAFLVPLVVVQHKSQLLALAPAVLLVAGLALHGSVVGGDWVQCYLWFGLVAALLYFLYAGGHPRFLIRRLRRTG